MTPARELAPWSVELGPSSWAVSWWRWIPSRPARFVSSWPARINAGYQSASIRGPSSPAVVRELVASIRELVAVSSRPPGPVRAGPLGVRDPREKRHGPRSARRGRVRWLRRL